MNTAARTHNTTGIVTPMAILAGTVSPDEVFWVDAGVAAVSVSCAKSAVTDPPGAAFVDVFTGAVERGSWAWTRIPHANRVAKYEVVDFELDTLQVTVSVVVEPHSPDCI